MADSLLKVDKICDDFESRWRENNVLTIESFQEHYGEIFEPSTMGELIHQEIDLRHSAGLELDRIEYEKRFPQYKSFIQDAFSRVENRAEDLMTALDEVHWSPSFREPKVDLQIGEYKILQHLGSGSFGVVYRAVHADNGREFALKFPNENTFNSERAFERFKNEAELAKLLDHPSIVRSYGLCEMGGFVFIPQQLVEGANLAEWRATSPGKEQVVKLVLALAKGLAYAHRKGLVHRDIKPANILLDVNNEPLIADFGLAVHENAQHRLRGQRCGTPAYMSPEQVMGLSHRLDGRSDIWGLGVILYELLAKTRPFQGLDLDELFEEIRFRDERPLCMRDSQIDEELQRICLKCLAKPVRERYRTANELARDLENWERYREVWKQQAFVPLVSKGLRSFGPDDSRAFPQLLPGPRNRFGVPESIQFWKRQIESLDKTAGNKSFSVGVVFGPSGSGKSSFVRAGVLPNLDAKLVNVVFVESSALSTEAKLKSAIREAVPAIPPGLALTEIFDGLKDGMWGQNDKRHVIVLDQFEQWLHANNDLSRTALVDALRHCDGERLFSILVVRDEFWIGTSKFLAAVGVDFHEGVNGQRIDLFEVKHARKVLFLIGRALEKLPISENQLTRDQNKFIEKVIDELADNGHVISVHITMFAEMFKHRDWTLTELKKIGGLSGVGERFLDETFSNKNSTSRLSDLREEVRYLFEAFLPNPKMDIRGRRISESDLKRSAGSRLDSVKIDQAIELLDKELRLISQTDSESLSAAEIATSESSAFYQLTHDYLVPSIRNWLNRTKRESWRGRIGLKMTELSSFWKQDEDARFMPSTLDYLKFRAAGSPLANSETNQKFVRSANSRFIVKATVAALLVGVAFLVTSTFLNNRESVAVAHWEGYLSAPLETADADLNQLKPLFHLVEEEVSEALDNMTDENYIRNLLIMLQCDSAEADSWKARLPICFDREMSHDDAKLLMQYLKGLDEPIPRLKNAYEKADDLVERMNIACCMLGLGDEAIAVQIYQDRAEPDLGTRLSHLLLERLTSNVVLNLADAKDVHPDLLYGLLVGVSDLNFRSVASDERSDWTKLIKHHHSSHPDSGVHAMTGLLANRWGIGGELEEIKTSKAPPEDKDWWVVELKPGVKKTFVRVSDGEFVRGQGFKHANEHRDIYFNSGIRVSIPYEYWICDSEVSFNDIERWSREDDSAATIWSHLTDANGTGNLSFELASSAKEFPAFLISFLDVERFVAWLGETEDGLPVLKSFQVGIPTNDEWEYACRGDSACVYFWGTDALSDLFSKYAVAKDVESRNYQSMEPARQRLPNRLGAFDMLGNVVEFTLYTDRERAIRRAHYADKSQAEMEMIFLRGGHSEFVPDCTIPRINAMSAISKFNVAGIRLVLKATAEN